MNDNGWLGLAFILLVAVAGGVFKLARLRGEVSDRWGDRVVVAQAGLEEAAIECLETLQTATDGILVKPDYDFNPTDVVANPASMKDLVSRFLSLLKVRDRLPLRYSQLLKVGPRFLIAVAVFGLGVSLAFGHLAGLWDHGWVAAIGWILMVLGGVSAIVGFVAYAYLENALSKAEELTRKTA